jgi:hypothetical protein
MKEPDIYKYVEKAAKKYGFKQKNFRIFYLASVLELTVSRGNTVDNKEFEFTFSLIPNRLPGYSWGGYISNLKLDKSLDENILYPVFDTWLDSVLKSKELQLYMRSIKIKRICSKLEI